MQLIAFLILGEQIALIAIVVLSFVLLLIIWFCIWLVKRFEARLGGRVYLLPPGLVIVLGVASYLPYWFSRPNTGPPQVVPGAKMQQLIDALPQYANFGFSGMGYFKDKLYVGTNIGLAEVEHGEVLRLFQFQKNDSVVSGPWIDRANQILWAIDEHTHELLKFDGAKWNRLPMPTPPKGYYSRGDVLAGVRAVSGPGGFVLTGAGGAWKWEARNREWAAVSSPPEMIGSGQYAVLIGVLPMEKDIFLIRHESLPFLLTASEDFNSDTAVFWSGSWNEIPNHTGLHFFADEWTVAEGVGYVCTQHGELIKVSDDEISTVIAPGECETLTTSDTGILQVSFRKLGIYEFKARKWEKRASSLYPSGDGEYWTHLAVEGNESAYSIEGKPVVEKGKSEGRNMSFTTNAPTHLWLLEEGKDPLILLPRPK